LHPNARVLYVGEAIWKSLRRELDEPGLRMAILNPESVRILPDLALTPRKIDPIPDSWNPKNEKPKRQGREWKPKG
jgi:hypothetical protein